MAVGVGQLEGFDDIVGIVRPVVLHRAQVDAFQHLQSLNHHGPLAPRPTGEHIDALVAARSRGLHLHPEVGQVFHGQQATLLLAEADHVFRNIAGVEEVSGRLYGSLATQMTAATLCVDHPSERVGQVLLDQHVPGVQWLTIGEE